MYIYWMDAIRITLLPMELRGKRITGIQFDYNAGVKDYVKKLPDLRISELLNPELRHIDLNGDSCRSGRRREGKTGTLCSLKAWYLFC